MCAVQTSSTADVCLWLIFLTEVLFCVASLSPRSPVQHTVVENPVLPLLLFKMLIIDALRVLSEVGARWWT